MGEEPLDATARQQRAGSIIITFDREDNAMKVSKYCSEKVKFSTDKKDNANLRYFSTPANLLHPCVY